MKRPIVHIEIASKDPKASTAFYSKVFGWETSVDPTFDYHGFESGSVAGAFPQIGDSVKADSVIVYLESENIEADLEVIKANGGKPAGEIMPVPGMGRFVHFVDPAGALLALWQSDSSVQG